MVATYNFGSMYCFYKYSVDLPHGVVCRSAVCGCGIF